MTDGAGPVGDSVAARVAAAIALLDQPSREEWDDGWGWAAHEALNALRGRSERSALQNLELAQTLLATIDAASLPEHVQEALTRGRRGVAEAILRLGLTPVPNSEPDGTGTPARMGAIRPFQPSYLVGLVEALRDALKANDRPRITDAVAHLREALGVARRDSSVGPHQHTVLRRLGEALGSVGSAGLIPSSKHEVMGTYAAVVRRAYEPLEHADVRALQETLRSIGPLVRVPVIHIIHEGSTLCGKPGAPVSWGDGDVWVRVDDAIKSNCKPCIDTFQRASDREVP